MNVRIGAAILCALMILEAFPLVELFSQTVLTRGGKPVLIPEGPYGAAATSTPVDHYWFQTGAMGYSSGLSASSDYTAANVTIRTVFDKVNNDAHSYWVGGYISNGAFIQVGYLNEVSTTDQPYCCAWFYEYFPANNSTCCDPVIGLEGSAGPIGSWHTYTMAHTGNGVWSFYMDGRQLGSSPDLGATNSGSWAPAAIAEVAQATTNTDILGPAEFKDLSFRTPVSGWQPVESAGTFLYYGKPPASSNPPPVPPPNPYWVVEVEGQDNDFLVGSYLPQPPNTIPSQYPGALLWPTSTPPYTISFVFLDNQSSPFTPSWVSLRYAAGNRIYYTSYSSQRIDSGSWAVDRVVWHSVNVATPGSVSVPGPTDVTFHANVFSVTLKVIGIISGLPLRGASVLTYLPDSLNASVRVDSSGEASLTQFPAASYLFHITVPYGVPVSLRQNITQSSLLTVKAFGITDLGIIVLLSITIAVLVTGLSVRRERIRIARLAPSPPPPAVMNCARLRPTKVIWALTPGVVF
ncbi:hypothetical protein E6H29_01405 [Candidatus Bathyarchaeota archaeon]|nr:MAG: hypothetical protein E6H29_01405 [Candidatus Bathyarchaeota archaeon]